MIRTIEELPALIETINAGTNIHARTQQSEKNQNHLFIISKENIIMKPYLLLTPGPLTTSETVKEAMMTDWCTWDEDYNLGIVQELRKDLVNICH